MNSQSNNSLSVLMCVYDKDNIKHFSDALNSLVIQADYIDELIIVKNGSLLTGHEKIIKQASKFITTKTKKLEKNLGLATGLNEGVKLATSKWIIRFDSDDICCFDRFKIIKEKILAYGKKYDVFGTFIEEFDKEIGDLQIIRKVPLNLINIKKRLIFSNPVNHVTVLFKKELTNKTYLLDPNFYPLIDGFEDYALWAKLLKNNFKFINFPIITVYVRIGNNMFKRRGGIKYIINELKFRIYLINKLSKINIFLSFLISIIRIIIFCLPSFMKKVFYQIKRNFF